jgi:hypothetical protein
MACNTRRHDAPTIQLVPGGVIFDGSSWLGELSIEVFYRSVSEPNRIEHKFSNSLPWRDVLFYDDLGLYALHDVREQRIVYLGVAFVPEATPFPTRHEFRGKLIVNETQLLPKMTGSELPLKGSLNFVPGIGSTWKSIHDNGYVELNMKRIPQLGGKLSDKALLVSVTHSFLKE